MTRALPAGTVRRRAFFGLFDAEGWAWASAKAFFWFVIIIFVLGYIPDRAYYFTVNRTLEIGVLAWSPINLCPPSNEGLPCPAPVGAIVPWHASEAPALPAPRTGGTVVQVSTTLLYIGGSDGQAPQASTSQAVIEDGAIGEWSDGPALPEPRDRASTIFFGGSIYVDGGFGEDGAPSTTTYVLAPDPDTGALGEWTASEELVLPEARADAAIVALADGILLVGGSNADGPTTTTWKAPLNLDEGTLQAWEQQPGALFEPSTGSRAAQVGDYVWLYGGESSGGATTTVQRGTLESTEDGEQTLAVWAVHEAWNLPAGRLDPAAWTSTGTIYIAGGSDGGQPQSELWWAVPTAFGDIIEWRHLDEADLPDGRSGAAPIPSGSTAFLIGGTTPAGVTGDVIQADMAPQAPFFQLGLVGAVVPALQIEGEIGQQIGYLNAAGAGTVGFIALILIGIAYAHPDRSKELLGRVRRRRR
jgi:hypothetical protein